MQIRTVYPTLTGRTRMFVRIRSVIRYLFMLAGLAAVIVNLCVRGKPWSLVVCWSLFSMWNIVFEPDTFEFSHISMLVKVLFYVVVLLALIDYLLSSQRWALFVIPIVVFSTMIVTSVLFLIDIRQSMRNSMPLIWLMIYSLVGAIVYFGALKDYSWPVIVMGSISAAMLVVCIFFNKAFISELKKRFHTDRK